MAAQMTVTFTKVRGVPALHRWPATPGLLATSLSWTTGLPHDLGHWVMEAQVDLQWGFWSLAGQQAPFASLDLVEGAWPKGRQEWFDRVRRKHGLSMLHAESQDGAFLADPNLDVRRDWRQIRELLARTYAFGDSPLARFGPHDVEKLRPFALRAAATWEALPPGGSVEVSWPGANDLTIVSTDERSALALSKPRTTQVRTWSREIGRDGREQLVETAFDLLHRPPRRPPKRRRTAAR